MMIGLVTGGEKCGCYVRTLRMLCTEKATVWSAPDGSDKYQVWSDHLVIALHLYIKQNPLKIIKCFVKIYNINRDLFQY